MIDEEKMKDLTGRLLKGDMEAFDEIFPNAKPEDRIKTECFIKMATQDDGKHLWLATVWYLFGWNATTIPNFESLTEEMRKEMESRGIDVELLNPKEDSND